MQPWKPQAFLIQTSEDYTLAGERVVTLKAYILRVHEVLDPGCKSAHEHWQDLLEGRRKYLKPAEDELAAHKQNMDAWLQAEQARAAEEQRRQDALAREQAEKEQLATAAAIELEATRTGSKDLLAVAEDMLDRPPLIAPSYAPSFKAPSVAGLKAPPDALKISVEDVRLMVLSVAAGAMRELVLVDTTTWAGSKEAAQHVLAFLEKFGPYRYAALEGERRDKDNRLTGTGAFDYNPGWLRREVQQRQKAFSMPGVDAAWKPSVR